MPPRKNNHLLPKVDYKCLSKLIAARCEAGELPDTDVATLRNIVSKLVDPESLDRAMKIALRMMKPIPVACLIHHIRRGAT